MFFSLLISSGEVIYIQFYDFWNLNLIGKKRYEFFPGRIPEIIFNFWNGKLERKKWTKSTDGSMRTKYKSLCVVVSSELNINSQLYAIYLHMLCRSIYYWSTLTYSMLKAKKPESSKVWRAKVWFDLLCVAEPASMVPLQCCWFLSCFFHI